MTAEVQRPWVHVDPHLLVGATEFALEELRQRVDSQTSSKIKVVAKVAYSITRSDIIPSMEAAVTQHKVITQTAGSTAEVNSTSVLREEDGQVCLTCIWLAHE
jgi:hypothetical protein